MDAVQFYSNDKSTVKLVACGFPVARLLGCLYLLNYSRNAECKLKYAFLRFSP